MYTRIGNIIKLLLLLLLYYRCRRFPSAVHARRPSCSYSSWAVWTRCGARCRPSRPLVGGILFFRGLMSARRVGMPHGPWLRRMEVNAMRGYIILRTTENIYTLLRDVSHSTHAHTHITIQIIQIHLYDKMQ